MILHKRTITTRGGRGQTANETQATSRAADDGGSQLVGTVSLLSSLFPFYLQVGRSSFPLLLSYVFLPFFLMVFILAFVMDDKGMRFGLLKGAIFFFQVQNGSVPRGFLPLLYIKKLLPPFSQTCRLFLSTRAWSNEMSAKKSQSGCVFLLFE